MTNQYRRENMRKQIRISPEVHAKIIEHLEKKELRVLLKSWVEKACLDLIKKELPNVAIKYFNRPKNEWHIDPKI